MVWCTPAHQKFVMMHTGNFALAHRRSRRKVPYSADWIESTLFNFALKGLYCSFKGPIGNNERSLQAYSTFVMCLVELGPNASETSHKQSSLKQYHNICMSTKEVACNSGRLQHSKCKYALLKYLLGYIQIIL